MLSAKALLSYGGRRESTDWWPPAHFVAIRLLASCNPDRRFCGQLQLCGHVARGAESSFMSVADIVRSKDNS
eukprot:14750-Eustigmatos_ZCMA.PRE.1